MIAARQIGLALGLAAATLATPAAAQTNPNIIIRSPTIGGVQTPPYGPGFDNGVIVGGRTTGCRNYSCPPGNYANRPYHRRYYDRYFDVPKPAYSGQRRIRGNSAIGSLEQWCAARYRSYRSSDNTFQPLSGARRLCVPF